MPPSPKPLLSLPDMRRAWHETHARLRQLFRSPRYWLVIGVCVTVTAVAGPFGTLSMSFPRRLAYWVMILPTTILIMSYLSGLMRDYARRSGLHWVAASVIAGLAGSVPLLALSAVVGAALGWSSISLPFLKQVEYVIPIMVLTTLAVNAVMPHHPLPHSEADIPAIAQAAARPLTSTEPSPLFDRLPPELGREIVVIKADNHHLEVTTPRGQARVLMRLADAEAELSALPGLRVHRSWWVNLSHVARTDQGNGGPKLHLTNGQIVPVARGQRAAVRAGLALPADKPQ